MSTEGGVLSSGTIAENAYEACRDVPGRGGLDPHPWRAAIGLTLLLVAFALGWTMWLNPLLHNLNFWVISGDSWSPLEAGRFVSAGAYPYLYQADDTWVAGPLLPVLLAPIAAIQDGFNLTSRATGGYGFNVDGRLLLGDVLHPTVWVLYATYTMGLCWIFLVAVRRTVWSLLTSVEGSPNGLASAVQVVTTALGLTVAVAYFMHAEDVLAVAALLFAFCAGWRSRWTTAAVFVGAAIAFKQWALLPALLMLSSVPRHDRRPFLLIGLGIPGVLYGIPLLAAPSETIKALFNAGSGPWHGHAAPWIAHPMVPRVVAATPGRIIWVVIAATLAWLLRQRRDPETVMAAAALMMSVRLGTESVIYSYYLFGIITFVALLEVVQRRSVLRTAVASAAALAWFWVPPPRVWWWFVEMALIGLLVWPAARSVWRAIRRPGLDEDALIWAMPAANAAPDPGRTSDPVQDDVKSTATSDMIPPRTIPTAYAARMGGLSQDRHNVEGNERRRGERAPSSPAAPSRAPAGIGGRREKRPPTDRR